MNYDSRIDTLLHIRRVNDLLLTACEKLQRRAAIHDTSKLVEPEKSAFDALVPKLKDFAYGSEEYRACLRDMKPALAHHYAANSHHPEHYPNGIEGMSLLDVLEMLLDWKAASERMQNGGSIEKSIEINTPRFTMTPQLAALLTNTAREFGWLDGVKVSP